MAHSRSVTNIIADVRLRADIEAATTRHTDASLLRFVVESWQSLRALLTDAGSSRFLVPVEVSVTMTQTVTNTIQFPLATDVGTAYDSVHSIRWQQGGVWYELQRVGMQELLDQAETQISTNYPRVWCEFGSADTAVGTQDSRVALIAPYAGTAPGATTVRLLVMSSLAAVDASTVLQVEEYGFDWLINHVVLKVLQRDNDAQDRMAITAQLLQDAEKRIHATLARENSAPVKRRMVAAARRTRRAW